MSRDIIPELLKQRKVIIANTHVVFTSRRHGDAYVNKDALFADPNDTSRVAFEMAMSFHQSSDERVAVVIGPAVGGAILAQFVAYHLSRLYGRPVKAVFADKDGKEETSPGVSRDKLVIKRGYPDILKGEPVPCVEDVLTTGGSARQVAMRVQECGGKVLAVVAICNRGKVTSDELGVPTLISLLNLELQSWAKEDCPLCASSVSVNIEVGKGREFLAEQAAEAKAIS